MEQIEHNHKDEHLSHFGDAQNHQNAPENESNSPFIRIAVIVGILIILFFISFQVVKFIPKAITSLGGANVYLSSIFSGGADIKTNKKNYNTGEDVLVSWDKINKDNQFITWSYKCTSGIGFEYLSSSGKKPVICETHFPLPANQTSYPFTVSSANKTGTEVETMISVFNKETNKLESSDKANIKISPKEETYEDVSNRTNSPSPVEANNTNEPATGATAKPISNTSKPEVATNKFGNLPDLSINLVKIGRLDNAGKVIEGKSAFENDKIYLAFNVINVGDAPSGNFIIKASLPTKNISERTYFSGQQPSFLPSQSYQFTLIFDSYDPTITNIVIYLESAKDVNLINNMLSIPMTSLGSNGGSSTTGSGTFTGNKADLNVKILDVGVINGTTFNFTNSLSRNDKIGIKFEVENKGGAASGLWTLEATVPGNKTDLLNSRNQPSILPGQKVQFTMSFDSPKQGSGTIKVTVDEDNTISENNENDNTDSKSIYINN